MSLLVGEAKGNSTLEGEWFEPDQDAPSRLVPGGDSEGGSYLLADPIVFAEKLTTFAPNMLPLTGFYSSLIPEIAQRNAQALVFGSLGTRFVADQEVVYGHRHDTLDNRLRWRQHSNVLFFNNGASSIGSAPDECYDAFLLNQGSETELAWMRGFLSGVSARWAQPRIRLSNAAGAATITITLYYYQPGKVLFGSVAKTISTATLRARAWVDLGYLDLSTMAPDESIGRIPIVVLVKGSISGGESAAVHEIAFGVYQ